MNKIYFFIIGLLIPAFANADVNKCELNNAIHCVKYLGNQSQMHGKYVRVTHGSVSQIHCTRGGFYDFVPQQSHSVNLPEVTRVTYEQCSNSTCRYKKLVGVDTYRVTKNEESFISTPRLFQLHLIDSFGQSCKTWK